MWWKFWLEYYGFVGYEICDLCFVGIEVMVEIRIFLVVYFGDSMFKGLDENLDMYKVCVFIIEMIFVLFEYCCEKIYKNGYMYLDDYVDC